MSVVAENQMNSIENYIADVTQRASIASREIASASTEIKNNALKYIAERILESKKFLKQENAVDLVNGKEHGLDAALLDRLELNDARIQSMVDGLHQVVALPDSVGEVSNMEVRPSGIKVGKNENTDWCNSDYLRIQTECDC